MAEELEAIAEELGLPAFRVPAPKASAQHAAATIDFGRHEPRPGRPGDPRSRAGGPPVRQPTRQFTVAPTPGDPPRTPAGAAELPDQALRDEDFDARNFNAKDFDGKDFDDADFHDGAVRQFAGIDIDDFVWARQRARRATAFWVLAVLVLTGLVAAAAWSVGTNLDVLFTR
jgi:serine/threonine-protein kinase